MNVVEMEAQANWLIPTCFQVLEEEKQQQRLLVVECDEYWLVQNLIKTLDSFMQPYWIDFINGNKADFEDSP
jgi:hypothetical protein